MNHNLNHRGVIYSADGKTLIKVDYKQFKHEHYSILEGVSHIGANAFHGCSSLKSIWVPDSVISEEGCLCEQCKNLEQARISKNIRHPDIAMFNGCVSLKEVILHEGLISIGENMFSGCKSLKSIKIPNSVKILFNETFCNSGIEEIILPNGLETIGNDAFLGCYGLKRLTIPSNVKTIGCWLIQAHDSFEGITCHSPYFRIEDDCLISNDNDKLIACWSKSKEFHLPKSVKIVGSICNDVIETIVVDSALNLVGRDALISCTRLKQVIYNAPVAHIEPSYNCDHIESKYL